ncbi:MAG: hypothetical protein OEY52_07160 [Gammaproteobacteria bacterium]|nr:hypothetical protein [Gammaproteobacteria bacterium]
MNKFLITLALLITSFLANAGEAPLPDYFIGRWAPTLQECKKHPVTGDDYPNLITLEKSGVRGYESYSRIKQVVVISKEQVKISGMESVEGQTVKFEYQLKLTNSNKTLIIRYAPETPEVKYVRCS